MKTNLFQAFQDLRRNGYFARMNFKCCLSCAWYEIPNEEADKVVFYHNQDNYDFKQGEDLYLAWAGNANEIISILQRRGLVCEWDGSANSRIVVKNESVKKA
jgi:hypothetical protein